MRILLLNDYGTTAGGAEVLTFSLRDGLRRRGHEARLLASGARLSPGPFLADDACFGTTNRAQALLEAANVSAYGAVRRVLAEFRPDVVHISMFLWQLSPIILPLLRGVPCVYYAMTFKSICPTGSKMLPGGAPCTARAGAVCWREGCVTPLAWGPMMIQRALFRRWRGAIDRIVAVSAAVRDLLETDGIRVAQVIHPGVRARPPRAPLPPHPLVAFAGRLVPEKGADVLIEAFARIAPRVPEARLVIAGDGPERPRLAAAIARHGLGERVEMSGHLDRDEVERAFEPAWVQAVPSRWSEPFGLVALEAMMRGTPVVASRAGGLVESVVPDRTGFLVTPGDPDALGAALLRVLTSREAAERLGAAGREEAIARFDEGAYLDRFEALYRDLAKGGERRCPTVATA